MKRPTILFIGLVALLGSNQIAAAPVQVVTKGAPAISKAKFEPVYRAFKAVDSATQIGISY